MIHSIDSQSIQANAANAPDIASGTGRNEAAPGFRARVSELAQRIDPEAILPPEPPAFTGNRAVRRARDAFAELRSLRNWSRFMRATAWVTTFSMLHL
ncbi:MAG: hypothetical protein RIF32_22090, partial [Leptospirales bacterium]